MSTRENIRLIARTPLEVFPASKESQQLDTTVQKNCALEFQWLIQRGFARTPLPAPRF